MSKETKNKIVPELRFPEFKDTGEWYEKRLEELISDFIVPMRDKPKDLTGEIPWCRIEDFDGMYLQKSKSNQGVSQETIKEMNLKVYPKNTLLVSCSADLGRCAITSNELVTNQTFIGLVHKDDEASVIFLFYLMTNSKNTLNAQSSGTTISYLSREKFEKFEVYVPQISEQQKIASCLSSLDDLITAENQKLEALKAHKKGLMQKLFPAEGKKLPELRFEEFKDSGEWEEKKLDELLQFKNGINASKELYGKGIKFINVLDILNNEFITYEKIIGLVDVSDEIVDNFSVKYGDILFQRSSETQEEVGTANVYLDKERTSTFGGFVIRGKKIAEFEPLFLNKLLKTQSIRNSISSKSGGSTRFNIGQEALSSVKILIPSICEQQKIAFCLSSLDELSTSQVEKIEALKEHKKGLMQGLFPMR